MTIPAALELIKKFEGCKLQAYPDPATGGAPWTIGHGSTRINGKPVSRGMTITQAEADQQLAADVEQITTAVSLSVPGWSRLNTNQQAALISFSYNCGPGWYGAEGFSTLSRVIREGKLSDVPAALMLYVNPGTPATAGLQRRRRAEGELWSRPLPGGNSAPITLEQLFRFNRGLPHQMAAVMELETDLATNGYAAAMRRDRPWFKTWSVDGKQPSTLPLQQDMQRRPVPTTGGGWRLERFPFFAQQDNGPEGWRQCQTSSIAMALRYLGVAGITTDVDYLRVVERFGDTTVQEAHRKALASLKVRARFVQNCTVAQAQAEIKAGLPVVAGVLHHGPVSKPSGGGHYVALWGFDDARWFAHDPYGELNLQAGGWARQGLNDGRDRRYSYGGFNPRWLPEGPASGWAWLFS